MKHPDRQWAPQSGCFRAFLHSVLHHHASEDGLEASSARRMEKLENGAMALAERGVSEVSTTLATAL